MKIDLAQVSDNAEEVADLEEFVAHLINGKTPKDAIALVWPDEPDTKPKVKQYVSDVNGVLIGWATCGGCNKHVSRCTCSAGPSEPAYFDRLREDEARRQVIAAGEHPDLVMRTPVASKNAPAVAPSPPSGSSTSKGEPSATTPLVPCAPGKHLVPVDTADKNDDGSYTCFACQSGAAQDDGSGASE